VSSHDVCVTKQPSELDHQVKHSDLLDHLVRAGMVTYGLVHVLLGWLAIQLVIGDRSESASPQGALHELATKPLGRTLVWAVAVGMLLLVGWRLLEAVVGDPHEDGLGKARARAQALLEAVVFGALGVAAVRVALGSGGSGNPDSTTAKVMALPAGSWLVAAVGVGVVVSGLVLVWIGWTERFAEHLEPEGTLGYSGAAYLLAGQIGHIAKGVSLGLIGGLLTHAGITRDPDDSAGLDQALQKVLQQPFGVVLIAIVAAGFLCYGFFCFARARHLDR